MRIGYDTDPRARPECGSTTGYQLHYRRGERACRACLDAHAAYKRQRRAQLTERITR